MQSIGMDLEQHGPHLQPGHRSQSCGSAQQCLMCWLLHEVLPASNNNARGVPKRLLVNRQQLNSAAAASKDD